MPAQKPNVKKAPPPKKIKNTSKGPNIGKQIKDIGLGYKRQLLQWAKKFEKFRDIITNNYDLGRLHLSKGNISDAILRFRFVTWLEPKHGDAWYYLGCSYMADNNKKLAMEAFRKAQKFKAATEETAYMLAIAMGKATPASEMPKKIPLELVREHFDAIATSYTMEQVGTFKYEGHAILCNAVRASLVPGRMDHVILELGVGSGLCGSLLRDVAAHITGVDISANMLTEAMAVYDGRNRKIYDALINRELQEFINDAPDEGYDIVMSAATLSYVGDLEPVFRQVTRILKPGGVFAFTADKIEGADYLFDPEKARFAFSQPYFERLAEANNLMMIRCRDGAVYPEYTAWVCVFRK